MTYKSWPGLTYKETIFSTFPKRTESNPNPVIIAERSWLHEDIQDRETLLIAVGDSWTWGDSICGIESGTEHLDHPDRTKHIYGAKLSRMLNSDFVNIGRCGCSNHFILKKLEEILPHNYTKYKKIYVVITLTENFRDLYNDKRQYYTQETQPFVDNPVPDEIHKNFYAFLKRYEKTMFLKFKDIFEQYKDVKFLIGRNFTYSFDESIELMKDYHLDKTWVDCLDEHQENIYKYPKDIRVGSDMAVSPLEWYYKSVGFFDDIIEDFTSLLEKSEAAFNWLMSSTLNHKKGTKHPIIEGHEIWAKYLYENLTKENS